MNIDRAGRQQLAYWRAEENAMSRWEKEAVGSHLQISQFLRDCERRQGFATGWIAAIGWMRRNGWRSKR